MAEQVQLHLEERLPELQDLLDKGIFSESEVKNIINHRTKYEYRLKRRGAILEDYLAYIEYEKLLEVERKDRIKSLNIKRKHSISDHSILEHIYGLYQRALVKFRVNISLWTQFLEYALAQGGRKVFTKNIARAMQFHPLHANFWIMAANFEWHSNGNMTSARSLLQRALQMLPKSLSIFYFFFELELDFAVKVIERREVLGVENQEAESGEHVLSGGTALLVFEHALESIPKMGFADKAKFLVKYLSIGNFFSGLLDRIIGGLLQLETAPKVEEVEMAFAELAKNNIDSEKLRIILSTLDTLLMKYLSPELILSCCLVLNRLPESVGKGQKEALQQAVLDKIDQLLQMAEEKNIMDSCLVKLWIDLAPSMGYSESSLSTLKERLEQRSQKSLVCFPEKASDIASFLKQLRAKDDAISVEVVLVLANSIKDAEASPSKKVSLFIELSSLPRAPINGVLGTLISFTYSLGGMTEVKKLFETMMKRRIVDEYFYLSFAKFWESLDTSPLTSVRELYEKALIINRSNPDIWDHYIRFERSKSNVLEASQLLQRAKLTGLHPHSII